MLILLAETDSTDVDTLKTYEVPEIVSFYDGVYTIGETVPAYYEQSITDMLNRFPIARYSCGEGISTVATRGRKPSYTYMYLNGRRQLTDPTGYFNLAQLPLHFFDRLSYGHSLTGAGLTCYNFESKLNRYDKPYSYARFMFGSFQSNIYEMDLTRAITDELGLYLSGSYYKTSGYRENADGQQLSLYSHIYYNRFLPLRLDIFYYENDYGFPGSTLTPVQGRQEDEFLDINGMFAHGNSTVNIFYNVKNMYYVDSLNDRSVVSEIKRLGCDVDYHHDLLGATLDYGVAGYFTSVDGDVTSYKDYPLDLWVRLNKPIHRFALLASGYVGIGGDHETFYFPRLEVGYDIVEPVRIYGALSKDARVPSDLESNAVFDTLNPYACIGGNSDLVPEYCWAEEIGVRSSFFSFAFYRFEFDDFITVALESANQYVYVNLDSWYINGCEGYFNIPLFLHNPDTSVTTKIVIGGNGNFLLSGDSIIYTPQYHGGARLSISRETSRFSFGITVRGELYGRQLDKSGAEVSGFSVVSLAGLVKFMSLSCIARLDNVFDKEYAYVPHYPMASRNFDFSIKWEFWD